MILAVIQRQQQRFLERWNEALTAASAQANVTQQAPAGVAPNEAAVLSARRGRGVEPPACPPRRGQARLLAKGGELGKRLDFLIQELHREANTWAPVCRAGADQCLGRDEGRHRANARAGSEHRVAPMEYPGNLFVVAAFSGQASPALVGPAGVGRQAQRLGLAHLAGITAARSSIGREYWFVGIDEFRDMVASAVISGVGRGMATCTAHRRPASSRMAQGDDVVLEIGYQGARCRSSSSFRMRCSSSCCRRVGRAQATLDPARGHHQPEVIATRMANARGSRSTRPGTSTCGGQCGV